MHLGYLNESKQEKSLSKKREIWNSRKRKKSEVINHFSSKNCFLIKYLCLRWRMAIFHYPFTDLKLFASGPLLSLIISFINPDQGSPSTLEASIRKVLSKSWTIRFWFLKEKYWTHPAESENVQTQEKHKQERTKARKRKKGENESQLKKEHKNSKRRQKDKNQEENPSHDDPWSKYP